MNENEFFDALRELSKEKNIELNCLIEKVKTAMALVAKKEFGGAENVFVTINDASSEFNIEVGKLVVEEVCEPANEISLDQARLISKHAMPGDIVRIKVDTKKVGRIAAQGAKQVIKQGIREAEREKLYLALKDKEGQLLTVPIHKVESTLNNFIVAKIGDYETILPASEQLPEEELKEGDLVKIYISEVIKTEKGPKIMISRTSVDFIKKLFEIEIPEIANGVVEIMDVAREAGYRTKIAVSSKNPNVDAVGTCIGQKGSRINQILKQIPGEKIDIIKYHEQPVEFIKSALLPAVAEEVTITDAENKCCEIFVAPSQISLAIGHKGQNARLVAKLTGYKIEIKKYEPEIQKEFSSQEASESIQNNKESV